MKNSEVMKKMIEKYGADSQIDVCIEEMSELAKALIKERRSRLYNREKVFSTVNKDNIKEELADVLFMMGYLFEIFEFNKKEIEDIIETKAARTLERYLK